MNSLEIIKIHTPVTTEDMNQAVYRGLDVLGFNGAASGEKYCTISGDIKAIVDPIYGVTLIALDGNEWAIRDVVMFARQGLHNLTIREVGA